MHAVHGACMSSSGAGTGLGRVYGWVYGWVYREGNTGTPSHRGPTTVKRRPGSGAGPVGPSRAGVGGLAAAPRRTVTLCALQPLPTLRARSVLADPPWQGPPLSSQRGRDFRHFSVKLVKTAECHRKVCIRPVIVPVSKTRA